MITRVFFLTILLLSAIRVGADYNREAIPKVHFDILEVNIYHNEWGFPVWAQIIAWDWHSRDCKFHVEWWRIMRDAFKETVEGRVEHEKIREKIRKRYPLIVQQEFLRHSQYKGDFIGGKYYPEKNHRTGKYEIFFNEDGKIFTITSTSRRITYTQHDPEREDREWHRENYRRGLGVEDNLSRLGPSVFINHQ